MILPLYRLLLRLQVTRARVISLLLFGGIGVIVGLAIGASHRVVHITAGARFIDVFGLSLLVPVATLVFASAALGDLNEDGTLVYLWLRPIARWQIVIAAVLSSCSVTWPVVLGPMLLAALATRAGADLVVGTLIGATVAMIGYAGLFVALGLRLKRALVWGLLYIFIWEGFVATANSAAARLALRSYSRSLLSQATGVSFRLGDFDTLISWVVPLAVAVVAIGYATFRLTRQDVA